jgi:hypothetical protein
MTWAQRLKRVFRIDIETCEYCGGAVRIIASIEDPAVIEKILGSVKILSHFFREAVPRPGSSCCRDSLSVLHLEQSHVHVFT